ncbi:DUF4041 domain-containing protein [Oerskovia jenensis]|nr:DUF4041 domain-containing protein [Oerskovia jenensis]
MPPSGTGQVPTQTGAPSGSAIPFFGARKKARELAGETDALRAEVELLRAELTRIGAMDVAQIEQERVTAQRRYVEERTAREVEQEAARQRFARELADLGAQVGTRDAQVRDLSRLVVQLEETALLQEVGIYDYQHPLENAEAYKVRLAQLRVRIKEMTTANGGAVEASTTWQVNGSAAQGRKMVSDISKLMLRAYNAEADTLVRGLKPHRLAASVEKLEKTTLTIQKLGTSMSIKISPRYHQLRIQELELTADFVAKLAAEKEAEREAREALREQRKVELETARERERLSKERSHYENAMAALVAKGDAEAVERMRAQIEDIEKAIADLDYRAANQRAGYVYVISNIGAFGEQMIKVGMTRRLDPMDRVKELGDASVPFGFDVHAIFFSDDAVGIENKMHQRLADRRVNRINLRREFFYATPNEALGHLRDLTGDVLTFEEIPEALEFRQSRGQGVAVPHA